MAASLVSQERTWVFGAAAIALALFGWVWFALCFTARAAARWNFLYLFAAIYVAAILIAIRDVRSWIGILALTISTLSLGCVSLFLFG